MYTWIKNTFLIFSQPNYTIQFEVKMQEMQCGSWSVSFSAVYPGSTLFVVANVSLMWVQEEVIHIGKQFREIDL